MDKPQTYFVEMFKGNEGFVNVYAFDDKIDPTIWTTDSDTARAVSPSGDALTDVIESVITQAASRLSMGTCCNAKDPASAVEDEVRTKGLVGHVTTSNVRHRY